MTTFQFELVRVAVVLQREQNWKCQDETVAGALCASALEGFLETSR